MAAPGADNHIVVKGNGMHGHPAGLLSRCYNHLSLDRHPSLWMATKQVRLVVLMSAPYSRVTLVHAVALLSLFLGNTAIAAEQHPARKHATKQEQPATPPPPALPPPPPTLEQMPALPPKVKFSNGMLTIVAENSTLADILRAVRAQTGAIVEIPPNATERVVTHLGPGPARDVLVSLLDGSHFNYVMLGSQTRPGMLDRIILTSKAGAAPGGAPNGSAAVPGTQNARGRDAGRGCRAAWCGHLGAARRGWGRYRRKRRKSAAQRPAAADQDSGATAARTATAAATTTTARRRGSGKWSASTARLGSRKLMWRGRPRPRPLTLVFLDFIQAKQLIKSVLLLIPDVPTSDENSFAFELNRGCAGGRCHAGGAPAPQRPTQA